MAHGVDYVTSKFQRHLGDRRAHDEGEFKRKEHLATEDDGLFIATVELKAMWAGGGSYSAVRVREVEYEPWAPARAPGPRPRLDLA